MTVIQMGCRGMDVPFKVYITGITGPFEKHKIIAFVHYYEKSDEKINNNLERDFNLGMQFF